MVNFVSFGNEHSEPVADPDLGLREGGGGGFACPASYSSFCDFFFSTQNKGGGGGGWVSPLP